jgi:hypothetical protein
MKAKRFTEEQIIAVLRRAACPDVGGRSAAVRHAKSVPVATNVHAKHSARPKLGWPPLLSVYSLSDDKIELYASKKLLNVPQKNLQRAQAATIPCSPSYPPMADLRDGCRSAARSCRGKLSLSGSDGIDEGC